MKRILIDLTPILPGGENGGAKTMTIELIRELSKLHRECEFVLLTLDCSHDELATLDAPNVRRVITRSVAQKLSVVKTWGRRFTNLLPAAARAKIRYLYLRTVCKHQGRSLLASLDADLLFCPFTAPFFYDPAVPTVSVVYDLQHRYYHQFFSSEEIYYRDRNIDEAFRKAACLICISDYVRDTVLRNSDIAPDHVYTVHIQLPFRLPSVTADAVSATLRRFELVADQFLLYPANFWAHKNHQMLLTAYGIYHARYSESVLKLVCTGAPGPGLDYFREAAMAMGLVDKVVFPGFIDDSELAALMASCKAVMFPSLFEGFGMPILEAMAAGKPVLCSNVTSLPEIAGDAALLFDPKRPTEIADAIRRIASDSFLVQELIDKGKQRVMAFGDAQKMAQQYWDVFLTAMNSVCNKDALHGVYPDGWCSERVHIVHQRSETARELALELSAPPWLPYRELTIKLFISDGEVLRYKLQRGGQLSIHRELPSQGGIVEMTIAPIFQPKALNINDDTRVLGCQMQSCSIQGIDKATDLFTVEAA